MLTQLPLNGLTEFQMRNPIFRQLVAKDVALDVSRIVVVSVRQVTFILRDPRIV